MLQQRKKKKKKKKRWAWKIIQENVKKDIPGLDLISLDLIIQWLLKLDREMKLITKLELVTNK